MSSDVISVDDLRKSIPSPSKLKELIEASKERRLQPVRDAAYNIVLQFKDHLEKRIEDPGAFTSSNFFSCAIPIKVYDFEDQFVAEVKKYLPEGYLVKKGHDGGGLYSTVDISW